MINVPHFGLVSQHGTLTSETVCYSFCPFLRPCFFARLSACPCCIDVCFLSSSHLEGSTWIHTFSFWQFQTSYHHSLVVVRIFSTLIISALLCTCSLTHPTVF